MTGSIVTIAGLELEAFVIPKEAMCYSVPTVYDPTGRRPAGRDLFVVANARLAANLIPVADPSFGTGRGRRLSRDDMVRRPSRHRRDGRASSSPRAETGLPRVRAEKVAHHDNGWGTALTSPEDLHRIPIREYTVSPLQYKVGNLLCSPYFDPHHPRISTTELLPCARIYSHCILLSCSRAFH